MNDLNSSGGQNCYQDAEFWSKLKQVKIIARKLFFVENKVWTVLGAVLIENMHKWLGALRKPKLGSEG